MDIEKFTDRAKGFLQSAQTVALRNDHQRVQTEHLLKALLEDDQGLCAGLITAAGGRAAEAQQAVDLALAKLPKVSGGSAMGWDSDAAKVLDQAGEIGKKAGDSYVTVERLLVALALAQGTVAAKILKDAGVTPQALNTAINAVRKGRTADTASAWRFVCYPGPDFFE